MKYGQWIAMCSNLLMLCFEQLHFMIKDMSIGHFGKYHNTFCLSPQILHKHCFQFLLGITMVRRENKNNAYAKFGGTNKEYYGIFRTGLFETCARHFLIYAYNLVNNV